MKFLVDFIKNPNEPFVKVSVEGDSEFSMFLSPESTEEEILEAGKSLIKKCLQDKKQKEDEANKKLLGIQKLDELQNKMQATYVVDESTFEIKE